MIDLDRTEKKYLRPDEFCEYFRIGINTFYRWVNDGSIKERPRKKGQHIKVSIGEARRFRDEGPRKELE